jgi:uncharacterized protein involved in exopolysaccharide biosynthesis
MAMKRMFWRSRSVITEGVENGAPVGNEAPRPRHRMKVILTLALSAALGGFLISYLFPAQYTSESTVLVEGQKVPDTYVQPIITSDFTQRIQTLSQRVLSSSRLRPVIQSLHLAKPDEEDKLIEDIQHNMTIEPVMTSMSAAAAQAGTSDAKKETSATSEPVPGFNVEYTDSNASRAQKICNTMTSMILDENLRSRAEVAKGTVEFLGRQVDDAKGALVEMDAHLLAISKDRSPRSPEKEAKYKILTLEYDVAQVFYKELLFKKSSAELGVSLENQQQGEQMHMLAAASLPESPVFPVRPLFALWGMGTGLLLGIGRALWPIWKAKTVSQAAIPHIDSAVPSTRQVSNPE